MNIQIEIEKLLLSYQVRKELNNSLASLGIRLHVALVSPAGELIPGDFPGISPCPAESNEVREEDIAFLSDRFGRPGGSSFYDGPDIPEVGVEFNPDH